MIERLASYFVSPFLREDRRQAYQDDVKAQLLQLQRLIPEKKDFDVAMGYVALMAGFSRHKETELFEKEPVRRDQAALRELLNAYRAVEDREELSHRLWDKVVGISQLQGKIRAASTTENALSSAGLASGLHHTREPGIHRRGRLFVGED